MSDAQLRNLERAATNGGATEQAALLRYKMRIGLLDENRINLAAYLDNEAALIAQDNWIHSDHIAGICPCGDCTLWNNGFRAWLKRLGFWVDRLSLCDDDRFTLTHLITKAVVDSGFTSTADMFSSVESIRQTRDMSDAVEKAVVPWLLDRAEENDPN